MNDPSKPEESPDETMAPGKHYERIRQQLSSSRARQFGLGGIFVLTALVAGGLATLRQSSDRFVATIIPLSVLIGFALSVTGIVLLCDAPRQAIKGNRRLCGTFWKVGLALLLAGLPGGILLGMLCFYLSDL